jgi:hypothetical protein
MHNRCTRVSIKAIQKQQQPLTKPSQLNHWEYLLTGNPFEQITDAEHSANPGDIVVSPEVWYEAGDMFEGVSIPNTNCHLLKTQTAPQIPFPLEKPYHLWLEHGQTMVR